MSAPQPDLFDVPAVDSEVEAIHADMEDRHAAFLARVRRIIGGMYRGGGPISTDEVWAAMSRYGIDLPPDASPNMMGSFFAGWGDAKPVGWTRSKREGSHSNLLRTWEIR